MHVSKQCAAHLTSAGEVTWGNPYEDMHLEQQATNGVALSMPAKSCVCVVVGVGSVAIEAKR